MPPSPTSDVIRSAAVGGQLLCAEDLDVPAAAMAGMERAGVIERVIRGIYVGAATKRHPLIEAAAWELRYPLAVACLLTAATWHDLTDAFARGTWLYVAKGTSVPRSRNVPLHIVQTAPRFIDPQRDEENDIATLDVHGARLRLTGPDRTVLDLWRYPARIPAEHALQALRRRVRAPDFESPKFARLARHLGVWRRLEPVLQGMVAR